MNLQEYAESRNLSYATLARWAQRGKLPSLANKPKGKAHVIADPKQLDREVAAARAPDRGGSNGAPDIDQALQARKAQEAAVPSFAFSRSVREAFSSRLVKLEYEQRSGKLIDKNELKLKLAKLHMGVRDALRTIPDRVAPILAAETDQAKIHAMLLKEIGQALESLSGIDWN